MHFIDEVKIFVKSGDGGEGCVSFLRAANMPLGGPDGGDGGRGGSVIFECVEGLNTLIDFRYKQHFKAKKGGQGMGKQRTGSAAEDLIIKVPAGTQVFDETGEELLFDITKPGQRIVMAKGGDGGLGNLHFKTSTNRAPRKATPGWPGEERWFWLRLKLLSDAGLVGMPNAGKSTFLSKVTRAKPKIADYPFTTLKPQLGVVYIDESEFVLADIPGLIEGAHEGHGLGDRFLKHIERCGVILHLVDGTLDNPGKVYKTIRKELEEYSELLIDKFEVVALNKCDALTPDVIKKKKKELEKAVGGEVFTISTASGQGLEEVLRTLSKRVKAFRRRNQQEQGAEESFQATEG